MSALTKPCNHFTNAVASPIQPIVPAEQVVGIEKVGFASQGIGKPAKYFLYFYLKGDPTRNNPVKVEFATSAARNTSYTNWIAANSTAIA